MTEPVCPYCRMAFEETGPPRIFCTACGTPHHEDCYRENCGCTVFGCSRAPADDPKLQVSHSDLRAVVVPAQPAVPLPQYPPSMYAGPLGLSASAPPAPPSSSSLPPPPRANAYAAPPQPARYQPVPPVQPVAAYRGAAKNRTTYIVLGIFLGPLGIHNFYAGYSVRAVGQLCLSVLTLGYLAVASWIWAIVEICIVDKDNAGIHFS
jgi:TM2 domain-containing membrane protein YozV